MMTSPFVDAILSAAAKHGSRPAFTFVAAKGQETTYTFEALLGASRDIADRMRRADVVEHDAPLGILLESQEDQTLHYLGALCAGAIPAILTPPNRKLNRDYYVRTMSAVLDRSRFTAVVTDVEGFEAAVRTTEPYVLESPKRPVDALTRPGSPLIDASFLQYSSGTTGMKRGVMVRDEAVLAQLHTYGAALELTSEDRIVSWLPLYHDMGFIACLNLPLLFGVHTIVMDPIDWVSNPALWLRAVTRFRGTLAWNPNFAYAFMAQRIRDRDLEEADLSSVRGLVNCSEPVTFTSERLFRDRFEAVGLRREVFMGCYAMAETTFALTHGEAHDPDRLDHLGPADDGRATLSEPYVSVGRPLQGVELEVMGPDRTPCADREVGELWVRSPFNLVEYHGNPEATNRAFSGDWYMTGDLGYRVADNFFVMGRKKDLLIVGGVNLFPNDLEEVTGQTPGVISGRTVAFSQFDPRLQTERVTVLAESEADASMASEVELSIRQALQASFELASFAVHVVPPGWLVKSSSGKIARSANREKWEGEHGRDA